MFDDENLQKSIVFQERYYSEYIDLWRFYIIKDKTELK